MYNACTTFEASKIWYGSETSKCFLLLSILLHIIIVNLLCLLMLCLFISLIIASFVWSLCLSSRTFSPSSYSKYLHPLSLLLFHVIHSIIDLSIYLFIYLFIHPWCISFLPSFFSPHLCYIVQLCSQSVISGRPTYTSSSRVICPPSGWGWLMLSIDLGSYNSPAAVRKRSPVFYHVVMRYRYQLYMYVNI